METVRIVTEDTLADAAVDGVSESTGPNAEFIAFCTASSRAASAVI